MKSNNFNADDSFTNIQAPKVKFVEKENKAASTSQEEFLSKLADCVSHDKQSYSSEPESKALFDRIKAQHRRVLEALAEINVYSGAHEILTALDNAIVQAQKLNCNDIARAREILKKELSFIRREKASRGALVKMNEIVRKLDSLSLTEETESHLRMTRGVLRLQCNDTAVGRFDIDAALNWCERLAQDPVVVQRIVSTGIPKEELKQWFPELLFDENMDEQRHAELVTAH